jgi:hypothetical protein
MFERTRVPVLGLIENMSYFCYPNCGHRAEIFRHGGARRETDQQNIESFGKIPLEWCFSANGSSAVGVSLAAVATDFWIALSLLSECGDWGLKAIAHLGDAAGAHDEMIMQCGLGQSLIYTRGLLRPTCIDNGTNARRAIGGLRLSVPRHPGIMVLRPSCGEFPGMSGTVSKMRAYRRGSSSGCNRHS